MDIIYDKSDVCNTGGTDCKDGDKVYTDRDGKKTAIGALTGLFTTYDAKVGDYETAYND